MTTYSIKTYSIDIYDGYIAAWDDLYYGILTDVRQGYGGTIYPDRQLCYSIRIYK